MDSCQVLSGQGEGEANLRAQLISHLVFQSEKIEREVRRRSAKAIKNGELGRKGNWLGVHYGKEIREGVAPLTAICYIDEVFGYGAFAKEEIALGAYVGEYVGLVRRRTFWKDRKNDYLFEYSIGDWPRNPYVIDAREKGNFTRFINHSETPNLDTLSVYAEGVMHIIFIAKKRILAGEQLSYHYGETFWRKRRADLHPL